ncbi:MAG: M48 family metalloprotease [Thermoanaerobaculia bacterium]
MRTRTRYPMMQAPLAGLMLTLLPLAGCATNPATGGRQLMLVSEAQESQMGLQQDEQILASGQVYEDPALQDYVQDLGSQLAAKSERPELPWTFRVLDEEIVNAFAAPGGYIYVTRGILSHLNSEAELATVLGHEIGHVTARHSANQISKQQLMGVGLAVGMILEPAVAAWSDVAQAGLGLAALKFSRDDERQADNLGLRYMVGAGYDPYQAPEVFDMLNRVTRASGAGAMPSWASTHPQPENRTGLIEGRLAEIEPLPPNLTVERRGYLQRLDGMVFGQNPREGYFEEELFRHPDLAFRIQFPRGWKTHNAKDLVAAVSPKQDAAIVLGLAEGENALRAAEEFARGESVRGERPRTGRINGLQAAWTLFEVATGDNAEDLAGRALFVQHGGKVYRIVGYTPRSRWSGYTQTIEASMQTFAKETDSRVLNVQPARVRLIRVEAPTTLSELYQRSGSSLSLDKIALLNDLQPDSRLSKGDLVKLVKGGPTTESGH